jgi:hypothetical protein
MDMIGNMTVREKNRTLSVSMKTILSFLLLVCLIATLGNNDVYAEDENSVEMIADTTNLTTGVSTNLSIIFTNASKPEIRDIEGIDNFDIISSSQSSSTQIINGNTTKQRQVIYTIVPKQEGTFQLIGNVTIDGVEKQTNTITFTVTKAQASTVDGSSDLYVKTVLSKEAAYVGEKIVLTYELYSRYNIEQYGFLDSISINNGLLEEVSKDNLEANYVTINGNKYVKYEAKKYIVTPIKAGTIDIPAFQFQANITDGGFFSQSKPMYLQSEAKTLQIQEIPLENQPAKYKGLVGTLTIESSYDKTDVAYGEPVTLYVTLSGNANLDVLKQLVEEKDYPDFTIYETGQPIQSDYSNNSIQMTKEAEIILVPKEIGTLIFAPAPISYFDTQSGTFQEVVIKPLELTVSGEKPILSNENSINQSGATGKILVKQTAYGDTQDLSEYFIIKKSNVYYGVGVALILFAFLMGTLGLKSLGKVRQMDANGKLRIEQIKKATGLSEQYEILCEVIKEKYGFSLKASTSVQREALISDKKVLTQLNEIVTFIEYGRYQMQHAPKLMTEQLNELVKRVYRKKD